MKLRALFSMLLLALPATAQFAVISNAPLTGACNGPALGVDVIGNGSGSAYLYVCGKPVGNIPAQWALAGGGGGSGSNAIINNPTASQTIVQPSNTYFGVQGTSLVNGIGGVPDSGANAGTVGTNNTWQIATGNVADTNYSATNGGSFWPIFAAEVAGVTYSSPFELQADQGTTYPNLVGGIVPQNQILTPAALATGLCDGSHVPTANFNNCISSTSTPGWNAITTPGFGNTYTIIGGGTLTVGSGVTINASGGGNVSANQLNGLIWPSAASGGSCNTLSSVPVVVASTSTGATVACQPIPNVTTSGTALGFNTSTNSFLVISNGSGPAFPMQRYPCVASADACPSTAVTGTGSYIVLAIATIQANTLTVGSGNCADVEFFWKHSTGTASVGYEWNVGGTSSGIGSGVTGGTTVGGPSSTQSSALMSDMLEICADNSTNSTMYAKQYNLGSAVGAANFNQGTLTWTSNIPVYLLFDVASTDALSFYGGTLSFK